MESAFGIDHGYDEIEKASFTGLGSAIGGATRRLGGKMAVGGAQTIKRNPGMGRFGQAQMKAGGGLRRLGSAMQRNPGMTGGITAGVGAAGAGAGAGAIYGNRRR